MIFVKWVLVGKNPVGTPGHLTSGSCLVQNKWNSSLDQAYYLLVREEGEDRNVLCSVCFKISIPKKGKEMPMSVQFCCCCYTCLKKKKILLSFPFVSAH